MDPATVIDVGAADGTKPLYETFPGSRHILIEPLVEFQPQLARIVASLASAEYITAAASFSAGSVELHIGEHLFVSSSYTIADRAFAPRERRKVRSVTLDEVWRDHSLQGPALLKIDVEGAEIDVLRGAATVLRHCEYLIVEVSVGEVFIGAPRMGGILDYLKMHAFVLEDILDPAYGPAGNLTMVDLVFVPAGRQRA